jgi:hypothetical protein
MGWSDCGVNSKTGENMGYGWDGICHAEDCNEEIDHGLSYVCGGMHEGGTLGCGYYFCQKHLTVAKDETGVFVSVCFGCYAELDEEEEEEG